MATYKVTTSVAGATAAIRLVEAKTKAQAIGHVVKDQVEAEVCTTADAVELGNAGYKIEKAGK